MTVVLMVAEKPMLADAIAKILSNHTAKSRKGSNGACSIHEFKGNFMGKQVNYKMTSTCGHVMSLDFDAKYNNWDRTDPVELYTAKSEKVEAMPKLKMNHFLSSEARECDYLVLWLDCDKEGENICFEVIDAVRGSMNCANKSRFMDNVYRAHFSAITDKDIKAAMSNLGRPNLNESLSVDARQELDLRIGCAFTRFQTKYFHGKYGDLDSSCVSFGPCQTPTLGFCVTRHDKITQFKPETYYVIKVLIENDSTNPIKLTWQRGRIFDQDVCTLFYDRVKRHEKSAISVADVSKKEGKKDRPKALNTVELLRVGSSFLGLGPAQTMSVAEHLYTQGYISYPRTETTAYPTNFDLKGTLQNQVNDPRWGNIVQMVLTAGIKKPKGGEDKGDHPPITPMRANDGRLSGDHLRIYEYVTQHFIATLMSSCRYITKTIKFVIGGEEFTVSGKTVTDPGFTQVMTWQAIDDNEIVPNVTTGTQFIVKDVSMSSDQTGPPEYLTESELITLMEKHGIGTDASIPVHINTICQRNYVKVETGRKLIPTKLGIALVHGYWRVDPELVLPTMRAELETQLNLIAAGKADFNEVKNHALDMFKQKFMYFVENVSAVDSLFEVSFTSLAETGKPYCRCGKCKRFMKLVEARPQRLYCPSCQDTYSLPTGKDGVLKTFGEKKCPLDEFELLYWQGPGGKLSRSYPFCPYCFNNPPFEKMPKGVGCNDCSHPTCVHSYMRSGVVQCPQKCASGWGVMVLDPLSGPKWRLCCNRCPAVIGIFPGASKVSVADRKCNHCDARFISAEFRDVEKAPFGDANFTGCVFCNEDIFSTCVNLNHAHMSVEMKHRIILGKMSWLFGMKPQDAPVPPELTGMAGGAGNTGDSGKGQPQNPKEAVGGKMAYSFDSTALERAAKAARELEKFSNAKEALELSRLQEVTRQKEVDQQTKQLEAQIQAMKADHQRVAEEERRKTLIEETKHARSRADYQDQLARKRSEDELALKARMQEENLRKQEESVKKQEALRKSTIEHELALKHKYDLEKVDAQIKAQANAARKNRDVNLEQLRAHEEERRKTVIEQIKTSGAVIGAGLNEFLNDKKKIVATVGGLTALAVGWYAAKRGTAVTARFVEARLGKPSLVRDTSRITPIETLKHPVKTAQRLFRRSDDPLKGVVLSPALESRLRDVAITTKNTKRNHGLFRNVLFYGPPGTGKTLFAKSLAQHSGLDYAIMTGGDVAPMGPDGVSAIHKVFDWAENSRNGLILFIDEADAFLRKRSTEQISEDMRAMLNAFLYRTGTQSRKFMLVVASNQPEQFDWAVNDRLDELVEFALPGVEERTRILLQYFKQYIADAATSGSRKERLKLADFDWIGKVEQIAKETEGMSGRELSKLVIGWQASAYASEDGVLTTEMMDRNVKEAMIQHGRKMDWLAREAAMAPSKQ
ncbi:hypothetical protein QR680_001411 [Steinernema hermaphroditum]|uniref:DNA topoisomerase n=1 Tax=Steinernema hermaphroditum TaxID=289476 RepID=A0AA39LFW0_9BILA|nr:hypothetical protein QR680_001411 [Steinernema hermaphroditum]